jgi:hypothetical protein
MRSVTSHGIDGAILANPELDRLRYHRHRISLRRTSDLGARIVKTCSLFFQLQSFVCHVTQNEGETVPLHNVQECAVWWSQPLSYLTSPFNGVQWRVPPPNATTPLESKPRYPLNTSRPVGRPHNQFRKFGEKSRVVRARRLPPWLN